MLSLGTSQKLQVLLAGAVNTNQCPVIIEYEDVLDAGGKTRVATLSSQTNDGTAVDLIIGIAEGRRIRRITFYNADLATVTLTFRLVDNGTNRTIRKHALLTLESLYWSPDSGWEAFDVNGNIKMNSSSTDSVQVSSAMSTGSAGSSAASSIAALTPASVSSQASSIAAGIVVASINSVSSQASSMAALTPASVSSQASSVAALTPASVSSQASSIAAQNPNTVSSLQSAASVQSFTSTNWQTVSSATSRVKSSFAW